MKHVNIYTDGCSLGNPGPGGYGIIIEYKGLKKEFSAGFKHTTNNRMELSAVIEALALLKEKCTVCIYTDSQYVVNGITKGWAARWRSKGWMRNKTDKAENPDLWGRLLDLVGQHDVKFQWVKGHAGHPENERCDKLSKDSAVQAELKEDVGYIK